MSTKAKKVEAPEVAWPESINLDERLPVGHTHAGYARFGLIQNGAGRIDRLSSRQVPQHLVDGALAAREQTSQTA